MKSRLVLVLKGMCMGFADVIPGVSGGTMALILGIYTRFIHAIKSVDLRFVGPLRRALLGGFKQEARADLIAALRGMELPWLATLGLGIAVAFGVGSKVIPAAMERYPEIMFAFFFGLVGASVSAPWRIMERRGPREIVAALAFLVGAYVLVGSSVTPPISYRSVTVEDGGQTLTEIAEIGPSALTPEGIYWDGRNEALRVALAETGAGLADSQARGLDPKSSDNPYNDVVVPAGTEVHVPAPAIWYIFIAGFVAICAMVLPGISGSFILLVMGGYYFMLNALKGFIKELVHASFPESQLVYVAVFSFGAALGLVIFSRVLAWLLERAPSLTMAGLVGLMIGCLRVIWPFKERADDGTLSNVVPDPAVYGATLWLAIAAAVAGVGLVVGLTFAARRKAEL